MSKKNEFKDKSPYIILNINTKRLNDLAEQGEEEQNSYVEEQKEKMIKAAKSLKNDDKLNDMIEQIEDAYYKIATAELREQYAQEEKRKLDEIKKKEYRKKLEEKFGRT